MRDTLLQLLEELREEFGDRFLKRIKNEKVIKFKDMLKMEYPWVAELYPNCRVGVYVTCLEKNIPEAPKCGCGCGEFVTVRKNEFSLYASKECFVTILPSAMKKGRDEKFNGVHPASTKEVKEKMARTNLERWGGHPLSNKEIRDRINQTNLEKYGGFPSSNSEVRAKMEKTNLERYGHRCPPQAKEIKKKIAEDCFEKYGVYTHLSRQDVRERVKSTNLEKYGHESAFSNDGVKEKIRKTNIEKYGVPYAGGLKEQKQKARKTISEKYGFDIDTAFIDMSTLSSKKARATNMERYGVEWTVQLDSVREVLYEAYRDDPLLRHPDLPDDKKEILLSKEALSSCYEDHKTIMNLSDFIGVSATTITRMLKHHNIETVDTRISGFEVAIRILLDSHGIEYETTKRDIDGLTELDIFIPSKNIGIECNGVYWHSRKFKSYRYHQEKSLVCRSKGIKLIHVWEDDWYGVNQPVIEKKILSLLGVNKSKPVHGRKCNIKHVKLSDVADILMNNHIQGCVNGSKWIALEHDGVLVACLGYKMTKEGVYDITRYATSTQVHGGFSKLLKEMKSVIGEFKMIYTFASLDYSHGDMYIKCGFTEKSITKPQMFYIKSQKKFRREKFMKHKLADLFDNYDEKMTEKENMENNGFYQLFDSGSIRFEMMG